MSQLIRHMPLVREVWVSNFEPIKSLTRYQQLATAATLMCGPRGDGQRSLVTPKMLLSEYNKDMLFLTIKSILFEAFQLFKMLLRIDEKL